MSFKRCRWYFYTFFYAFKIKQFVISNLEIQSSMLRLICCVLPLFLGGCKMLISKQYLRYFSEEPWEHIRLANEGEKPEKTDSMAVIYTNRTFHPERKQVIGDYRDSSEKCRPLLVTAKNGQWVIFSLNTIDQGVSHLENRNLVVYVEGMGKNFFLAAERAFGVSSQYKVSVVMMDYPSINPTLSMNKNFKFSMNNSFASSSQLMDLLNEMQSYKKAKKKWAQVKWTLFCHSMGNIMLKHILEDNMDSTIASPLFDNLILNAPCVDQKNHKKWLEKCDWADHIFLNYNKQDKQLNGAMILTLKRQLGARPKPILAKNIYYVNFNKLVGSRHSTFVDVTGRTPIAPHANAYFQEIFNGKVPDFSNKERFGKGWKGVGLSIQ